MEWAFQKLNDYNGPTSSFEAYFKDYTKSQTKNRFGTLGVITIRTGNHRRLSSEVAIMSILARWSDSISGTTTNLATGSLP